jgi:hypothetical protein
MDEIRQVLDAKPGWAEVRFDSVQVDGHTRYGITIGGVPIGHDDYVNKALQRKLHKSRSNFTKIISKLQDVSPQAAHAIITQHFIAEWTFTLRTVYPSLTTPFARRMDELIVNGLLQLTHTAIPPGSIAAARLAQPLRHGGCALRKLADLAAPAFIGAVCQCVPSFATTPTADGHLAHGILRHLEHLFGPTSFTRGNEATRFGAILAGGSRLGNEMQTVWDSMVNELPLAWRLAPAHAANLLSQPAAAMGSTAGGTLDKVQRQLTTERESYRRSALEAAISAALANQPAFNEAQSAITSGVELSLAGQRVEQAIAARSCDSFSSAFVQILPTKGKKLRPELWRMMYARRLGLPCPECAPHWQVTCGNTLALYNIHPDTGERTLRLGTGLPVRIGKYGHGLHVGNRRSLAAFPTARHDSCVWELCKVAWTCGIQIRREPKDLWQHLITDRQAFSSATSQARTACVPDIEEDRGGGQLKLSDGKMWSRCKTWFKWLWFQNDQRTPTALKRQTAGGNVMLQRCDAADRLWNATQPANPHGPIGTAARSYGRIEILGCGPYAEATPDTHAFVKRIAAHAANVGWRAMGAKNAVDAKALLCHRMRQRVGVAFARTTAEMTLRRLRFELDANRAPQRTQTDRRDDARRANAAASDEYDARAREPD